ncbi:MAG: hypothetical protein ACFB6R_12170 [Alphaproteobacteria bacterium]
MTAKLFDTDRPFRSMTWPTVLTAGLILALAACGGPPRAKQAGPSTNQTFQRALTAKEAGRCDRAIPDLERLARIGRGWELAQVYLAECLIDQGRDAAGAAAQNAYAQALRWLEPAASSNESRAQLVLAGVYLEGLGRPRDLVEAGKWYMLSRKSAIEGINDGPTTLGKRLEAALTPADWEAARDRADAWSPAYQGVNAAAFPRGPREQAQDNRQSQGGFEPPPL